MVDDNRSLPAIIVRASNRLLEAKTSAEVLEAKHMAEAALHYAKVTKAANETHADCLRLITRAEIRMANEIDFGQINGSIRTHGGDRSKVQSADFARLEDMGIVKQRVAEWREVRDAGEEKVERVIQKALEEGRTPTKREVLLNVRGTQGTGENEWYTPIEYIELARQVLGKINLDPASSEQAQKDIRAARFYTLKTNGLEQSWRGRIWLNPPYAQPEIGYFAKKMCEEIEAGRVTEAVMLTHNYTDTNWFHTLAKYAAAICFTRGRIKFVCFDGKTGSPTQGQAFFYFGKNARKFREVFKEVGFVVS